MHELNTVEFLGYPGTAALAGMEWIEVWSEWAAKGGLEVSVHDLERRLLIAVKAHLLLDRAASWPPAARLNHIRHRMQSSSSGSRPEATPHGTPRDLVR
jgi:hypothetical protein